MWQHMHKATVPVTWQDSLLYENFEDGKVKESGIKYASMFEKKSCASIDVSSYDISNQIW